MMKRNKPFILPEYQQTKGYFWSRSVLTYYAVRLNAKMRDHLRNASPVTTPCIAMHVRHSEKYLEAILYRFQDYMDKASLYKDKTGVSSIYLMTDDDEVIQSTKDYPNFQFYYLDQPRTNASWEAELKAGISRINKK